MHDKNSIAVIGDKDLILAFKAVGFGTYPANDAAEAEKVIKKIGREHAVIFITENLAAGMTETLEKYKEQAYPAIIPIPSESGASGFGQAGIKKDIERAVGTDILDD